MSIQHPLEVAIEKIGLGQLAAGLGVSGQAIRKWQKAGRMPRTEWTGETSYSQTIEAMTGGAVTRAALLKQWPESTEIDGRPRAGPVAATAS